jgi:hypothetical protein
VQIAETQRIVNQAVIAQIQKANGLAMSTKPGRQAVNCSLAL